MPQRAFKRRGSDNWSNRARKLDLDARVRALRDDARAHSTAVFPHQRRWASERLLNLLTDQELQALPDSVKSGKFAAPFSDYAWQASAGAVSGTAGVYEVVTSVTWPKNSYTVRTYQYRRPPLAGTTTNPSARVVLDRIEARMSCTEVTGEVHTTTKPPSRT